MGLSLGEETRLADAILELVLAVERIVLPARSTTRVPGHDVRRRFIPQV